MARKAPAESPVRRRRVGSSVDGRVVGGWEKVEV